MLALCKKKYDKSRQHIKRQRCYFANKGLSNQSYGFSVVMYQCEMWTIKKAESLRIDAFELIGEDHWKPLDCREIKSVSPTGNQFWIFTEGTDAETEALILWPPDVKNWFIWKDPDAGKDWRQKEKGVTEDEVVGWHYWLNGHEFDQAVGDGEGQGSLVCCSPWDCKESELTKQLNHNK